MTTYIKIVFTDEDVEGLADAAGVNLAVAEQRAAEWARYIQDTAVELCNAQLASVIETGQP